MKGRHKITFIMITFFVFFGQLINSSSGDTIQSQILLALDHFKNNKPPDNTNYFKAIELIIKSIRSITPKTKTSDDLKFKILKSCDLINENKWQEKNIVKLKNNLKDLYYSITLKKTKQATNEGNKSQMIPVSEILHHELESASKQATKYKYDDCLKSLLKVFLFL